MKTKRVYIIIDKSLPMPLIITRGKVNREYNPRRASCKRLARLLDRYTGKTVPSLTGEYTMYCIKKS
jgi:hypothetical protein